MNNKVNKDDLYKNLDNINQWINNSDNKTSIILGFIGIFITVIFTNNDMTKYMIKILNNCFNKVIFSDILYFIFLFVAAFITMYGIFLLVKVLIPTLRMKNGRNKSYIFFGSIAKYDNYIEYKNDLLNATENDLIDDLSNQIYQNSLIANNKYKNYTKGVKYFLIGFISTIIMYGIGILIYL